jgi:hypothetical protein
MRAFILIAAVALQPWALSALPDCRPTDACAAAAAHPADTSAGCCGTKASIAGKTAESAPPSACRTRCKIAPSGCCDRTPARPAVPVDSGGDKAPSGPRSAPLPLFHLAGSAAADAFLAVAAASAGAPSVGLLSGPVPSDHNTRQAALCSWAN